MVGIKKQTKGGEMSLKDTAVRYFKAGVTVFPTTNYRKNPSLKEWKKYQNKKPTLKQVKKWFSREDVTGILALCGDQSNITVVDDDSYKTGNPLDIQSPLEVSTTSGGRHIYFRYSDVENHNIRTDDEEFEIQNNGKLVMMPPSKAKNKQGEIGSYEWTKKFHSISRLPKLTKDFTAKYESNIKSSKEMVNLLDVDLGQQHNSLRTLTNRLLFQTPIKDWESKVLPVIRGAAKEYNPPHPPERVRKLWQDCTKFVKSKKLEDLQPRTLAEVSAERQIERKLEKKAPSTGFPNLDHLIKGFIPGHLYLFSGDTNVGKTSISANFAVNVAESGGRVLYLALEPGNTVIDYLNCVYYDISYDEIKDYEDYSSKNIDVYTKDQIKDLSQMIHLVKKLNRYDVIVVDHIGYFTTSTKGNTYEMQANAIKRLVQLAKQKKMALVVIAHLRKKTQDTPGINDIAGSAALKQDATEVMIVTREEDIGAEMDGVYLNSGIVRVLKTKVGPNGYFPIRFRENSAKIYDAREPLKTEELIQQTLIKQGD